ncbi:Ppx/GppA family phosphatase [Curvivirga aplysinae]|uniref:Ppx/GppA family phosphatase n=1 Tax=Curvivirga aplysinae TaxID=2529852 RepID=UPI0012BCDC43|nr:Ppx/GppA family phosphatase [Curvivirga aplysinae]MTI10530.1 Ppx/GppA family phosphatase [Curvivirga aplysinae]
MTKHPLWAETQENNSSPIAVVDIGSNSIRLVIYEGRVRAPIPVFNEKILCGLGRDLNATGRLHDEGVERALRALPRFANIARSMKVSKITVLATAAVREAENGPEFTRRVKELSGLEIQTISGHEEARLSGLGVISGIPNANGFMGDLGGGSVELVELNKSHTGRFETLPLGPIRMSGNLSSSKNKLISIIDPMLEKVKWLSKLEGKEFYVVGGAWRAIAKIHMEEVDYPLHVLHGYEMEAEYVKEYCDHIFAMGDEELLEKYQDSTRRVETLRYAALLMQRVIRSAKPNKLVFSANGVREGCLFDKLGKQVQAEDPLLAACHRMPWSQSFDRVDGEKLFKWIDPIFKVDDQPWEKRIREAACLLSEIGRLEHPDYRVDHALNRVMRFPIVGVTHKERVYLALAVATRYGTVIGAARGLKTIEHLLSEREIERANAIGCAMRLGYALTGGVSKHLKEYDLRVRGRELLLTGPADKSYMAGEVVEKRMANLAKSLGLYHEIRMSAVDIQQEILSR